MQTGPLITPKKVFLETFGCQSNTLESLHLRTLLRKGDFSMTDEVEEADVVLFNTCSIRQNAEHKVFSRLGHLGDWKAKREGRVLGVLGCMATSYKAELFDRVPHLDLVLGPDQYPRVAEAIQRASDRRTPEVWADFDPAYFPMNEPDKLPSPHRAFVEIMKGCDKFCTFCVVPFTRGREVSRAAGSILDEIRSLVEGGVREITLLGQNVNSYGLDGRSGMESADFPNLLRRAVAVEGLARLRFMTSHPIDLSDDLAAVFAETDVLGEYFHLPVQCGSDRVLKRMNRKYTAAHYLDRVRALKSARPEMCLSTDLIVGFPGESDADFEDTLRLLDEVRFDMVYSFKYSARQGTPAARMLDQVPEALKDGRLARLNEKTNAHAAERAYSRVGRVEDVMVEGPADRTPGAFYGKTGQNRVAVFPGRDLKAGERVRVKITGRRVANLFGDVVE